MTDATDFVDWRMFLDFSTLVSTGLTFFPLAVLLTETLLLRYLAWVSFAAAPLFFVVSVFLALPLAFLAEF